MLLGLSCILMFTLYHTNVKSVSLNRYLNVDVNQDVLDNLYGNLVTLFPTQMKDMQVASVNSEVNDAVNNVNDNINDVVTNSISADDSFIHKNNGVHVGFTPVSEGITNGFLCVLSL